MIDKPPKITVENEITKSNNAKGVELDKIHKILSGELKPSEVVDEEENKESVLIAKEESRNKESIFKPASGGTWHDNYDNY